MFRDSLCGCWGPKLDLLQKQHMLLTAEPSLFICMGILPIHKCVRAYVLMYICVHVCIPCAFLEARRGLQTSWILIAKPPCFLFVCLFWGRFLIAQLASHLICCWWPSAPGSSASLPSTRFSRNLPSYLFWLLSSEGKISRQQVHYGLWQVLWRKEARARGW